jgi:hypothetical protein
MAFPQILEVALGLILIYYVLGAIVSMITQLVNESLETRGVALEKYLKQIAGEKAIDLTSLPQIKALAPIRYTNWWNVFGAATEEKKVEKIPVETLVDAFFDITGLTNQGSLNADELTTLIGKLPESEGRNAMLTWIQQGVTAVGDLRTRTSEYFAGVLTQASATFRARARSFVIVLSIGVTLLFGTDSIQLARDLWTDAGLRSLAAQQAVIATAPSATAPDLNALVQQLGVLSVQMGWWRGATFPTPPTAANWLTFILLKIAGLGITAAAVSQGSSFWYDLLKKATGQGSSPTVASGDASGPVG